MHEKKHSLRGVFVNGILNENPTFRLVLGVCPTLASTTSATNGLGMGLAATFVLLGSNVVISLLRNIIPDKVRIPAFIVVISTFVTIIQMLIQAFVPALYDALGLFIPLIVVNCIILGRAEAFAGVVAGEPLGLGQAWRLRQGEAAGEEEHLGQQPPPAVHRQQRRQPPDRADARGH